MSGLLIAGGGGHGKVVADTAYETGRWDRIAFVDDHYGLLNIILEWAVIGSIEQARNYLADYPDIAVAIGDNKLRVELLHRFSGLGFKLPSIVHPTAFVSRSADIEAGCVIFAQAAVNASAKIGFGSIINTGATVDHECVLGYGVHLSPGVRLAENVAVGNYSWLGTGAIVIPGVNIGNNVIAGAGAVVIKDIPDNVTVIGVPGKVKVKQESRTP